jgi:hypothetical protein
MTTPQAAVALRETLEPSAPPWVDGGYQTILAGPPWPFANRTGKVAREHRRLDRYSTMDFGAPRGALQ